MAIYPQSLLSQHQIPDQEAKLRDLIVQCTTEIARHRSNLAVPKPDNGNVAPPVFDHLFDNGYGQQLKVRLVATKTTTLGGLIKMIHPVVLECHMRPIDNSFWSTFRLTFKPFLHVMRGGDGNWVLDPGPIIAVHLETTGSGSAYKAWLAAWEQAGGRMQIADI